MLSAYKNYISLLKQRRMGKRTSLVDDFDHFVSHFNTHDQIGCS
jgi:hypothetical protein